MKQLYQSVYNKQKNKSFNIIKPEKTNKNKLL